MKHITSRTNPLIKHIALLQQKKYRQEFKQFLAEGERTCATLIHHGLQPLAVIVTERMVSRAEKMTATDVITIVPDHVMEKISTSESPSGIVCQFAIPSQPAASTLSAPGIVLAQITDPGNMGTLIRTAAALNIKSVVIVESTDPWSPKVVQASAGTIGSVSLFSWSWDELLHHKKKYQLGALVVDGGKNPAQISLNNMLCVVGSEAHGIPAAWIAQCDEQLTLPMPGATESLNAAVAGSIVLYLASQSFGGK